MKTARLAVKLVNLNALIYNPLFFVPTPADERRQNFFDDLAKTNLPINVMQKYFLTDISTFGLRTHKKMNEKLLARLKELGFTK